MSMFVFEIEVGNWCGWLETPPAAAGWAASPILIKHIRPLETDEGKLRVSFLQPIHPGGSRRREILLTIIQSTANHLVATFEQDGVARTAVISGINLAWLQSYCAHLSEACPPTWSRLSVGDYLSELFGTSRPEVRAGGVIGALALLPQEYRNAGSLSSRLGSPPTNVDAGRR